MNEGKKWKTKVKKSKGCANINTTFLTMSRIWKRVYKSLNERIRMKLLQKMLNRILPKDLKRNSKKVEESLNNNEVNKKMLSRIEGHRFLKVVLNCNFKMRRKNISRRSLENTWINWSLTWWYICQIWWEYLKGMIRLSQRKK